MSSIQLAQNVPSTLFTIDEQMRHACVSFGETVVSLEGEQLNRFVRSMWRGASVADAAKFALGSLG